MAAPVLEESYSYNVPYLVKRFVFEAGVDATAFDHGESRAPQLAFAVQSSANPAAQAVSVYSLTATQFTVDCEAASGNVDVILIWIDSASGGLSAP